MKNLAGQTAIISGGLGDIGACIARELASRGASISVGDVKPEAEAAKLLQELHAMEVEARYFRVDVSDARLVKDWVAQTEAKLGVPNLVIPNAAIVGLQTLREVLPEDWTREISINLNGAFYLAREAALRIDAQETEGRIVFVGSWAAHSPHPHIPAYSVAKAGMRMMMKCFASEFAPRILVNEIAPGYVDAGLSGKIFDDNPELKTQSAARVPLQRLIEPEEVASQVAHLCDPNNRHMTGGVLLMDGGLSL